MMEIPYVELVPAALGFAAFLVIRLLTTGVHLPEPPTKSEQERCELEEQQASELASELDPRPEPEPAHDAAGAATVCAEVEPEPGPEPDVSEDSGDEAVSLRGPLLAESPTKTSLKRPCPSAIPSGRKPTPTATPLAQGKGLVTQSWMLACAGIILVTVALDRLLSYYINNSLARPAEVDLHDSGVDAVSKATEEPIISSPEPESSLQSNDEDDAEEMPEALITMNLTRQSMAIQKEGKVSYYKSAYWGNLNVGDPSSPFKVVFDTGSGHLILPSTYCHSETCKLHSRYKRSASKTAKDIDYDGSIVAAGQSRDQITVNFGTGEVTGVFVEEIVCVEKGAVTSAFTREVHADDVQEALPPGCARMRFIAAVDMSEEPFKDFHFDGVLGLGLSGLSQSPEFNFPHVMAGLVAEMGGSSPHTFSVFLADHIAETSSLEVGGWSRRHFEGNLAWSPVHDPELGHWLVRIRSMYVDGQPVNFCQDGDCKAVVDTGTSLMSVPTQAFPEIFQMLRHPAPLEGSCRGDGPTLQIQLEGDNFTLTVTPKDYSREEPTGRKPEKMRWPKEPEAGSIFADADAKKVVETRRDIYCKPMLMAMDLPAPIGPKLFILGEPVLRRFYTVYDTQEHRVGFGLARHEPEPQANVWAEEDPEAWWYEE